MISFFLLKGHTLEEMLTLSTAEKLFYTASMEVYSEELSKIGG